MSINLNDLAKDVSDGETGEEEVNIAQIKEVIRVTFEELAKYEDQEILDAVRRGR